MAGSGSWRAPRGSGRPRCRWGPGSWRPVRSRWAGRAGQAGAVSAADLDPGLQPALLALVEPDERGDPMSPLRWTTKSLRALAGELTSQGHRVGADTVADLLREEGFSLQGNAKTIEGNQVPDRDAQFRYLNEQVREHRDAGEPVVSVDTKKKELVGNYHNGGREWRPAGEPARVKSHDFPDLELGKAIPYGIYDLAADTGWVNVGTDHDTAAFAVESIRRWWNDAGRAAYPGARRLLITADAGGSNNPRTRAWEHELAAFALQAGLEITACHFPPGTSKWNKIEHRLFSHITMNWRGRPLTSHEVIVAAIAATTTGAGLRVRAELGTGSYPPGATISDEQMAALPLRRHDWYGDWNYTLYPRRPAAAPPPQPRPGRGERPRWAPPALTGMPAAEWDQLTTALALPYQAQREAERHIARGGPATRRRAGGPPASAHPGRENPGHHPAAAPGSTQARPGRAVRRLHRHHRHSPTADRAAARTSGPQDQTRHHPAHHTGRPHRIRISPRQHAHAENQTSALIIDRPYARDDLG